jgi:SnoaL-like domain
MSTGQPSIVDPGIAEVFEALERHYGAKDFAAVRALWLPDLPAPFYIAEEHHVVMDSWEKVEAYWRLTSTALSHLRAKFKPLHAVALNEHQQLIGFELTWLANVGAEPPVAGTLRAAAICERTSAGWRIRAWIEAPLAPIVYMRELYAGVAKSLSVDGQGREIKS